MLFVLWLKNEKDVLNKLAKANLFMIGVGAIGCEMLKNFALLNIASDEEGLVKRKENLVFF